MNIEQMRSLLTAHMDRGVYVESCMRALSDATVRSLGIGRMSAREALGLWSIRQESLREAGVEAVGLPQTLRRLGEMGHSQPIVLQAFVTEREFIVVLVSGGDGALIGCFVKPERGTPGGGPVAPPLGPEFAEGGAK